MSEYVFKLASELTFATVPNESKRLRTILRDDQSISNIRLNLADVNRCDSAGLALLIDATRLGKEFDTSIMIEGIPDNIAALAEFSGIGDVLSCSRSVAE